MTGTRARLAVWLGAAFLALAGCASPPSDSGPEQRVTIPVTSADGRRIDIDATLYRPRHDRRAPLVVLSHGTPRGGEPARRAMGRVRYPEQAHIFLQHGFAVIVPTRRGYGSSPGPFAEGLGKCEREDFLSVARESARDVVAAIEYARALPFVESDRIVVAGISAGGLASLAAAATQPAGVRAVVNFAGGRGSIADGVNCNAPSLVAAIGTLGLTTVVPTLWIYASNDRYFGPALAQQMREAFERSGASVEFINPGSVQTSNGDGHLYFSAQPHHWAPTVTRFLAKVGLIDL